MRGVTEGVSEEDTTLRNSWAYPLIREAILDYWGRHGRRRNKAQATYMADAIMERLVEREQND